MKETINTILLVAIFLLVGYQTFFQNRSSSSDDVTSTVATTAKADNPSTATFEDTKTKTPEEPQLPPTTITFETMEHDFGTIKEGEKVFYTFKFTNTGKNPLVISNAKGSCGCTVPKWPKEPIPPGGTGEIPVEFDSSNKPGKQTKTVTITANTEPRETYLKITANVEKDPNKESASGSSGQIQVN